MSDVVNLTTVQQVPVTIDFQNVLGSPAAVTGITLAVSDPTVLTVSPVTHSYDECVTTGNVTVDPTESDSELAVTVASAGKVGTADLTVTGTNPDGSTITGTLSFNVVAADAVNVVFTPGTPVAIVPATPAA